MKLRYPLMMAAFALAGTGVWKLLPDSTTALPIPQQTLITVSTATTDTTASNPVTASHPTINAATLPKQLHDTSLADIDVPRSLTMDVDGHLVADEGLRELIDFFGALKGEKDPATIRALFIAAAEQQCGQVCAGDATEMFDRYQQYLTTMQSFQEEWNATGDLRERLDAVIAMRHEILGDTLANALFGYDEQYDQFRISQWEIRNNSSLSEQEKLQQLQVLDTQMPEGLAERQAVSMSVREAHRLAQKLGQDDPAALYVARTELLGSEAADRLQQLDQKRQQWNQRYQQYRQELAILQRSELSQQDKQAQLEQLRLRYFNNQETLRVAALDRINGTTLQ